ncbi:hypothetical protein TS71_04450 [Mycolicibacterium neoaurum]|uniref:Uncharacterized protein n=1 Tax=Mycolicibacterium neoaurum VKM Ac-1815D TaxID=700508 RepID=V5XII9_MYCNE|nr:hypothetical protein MyAD_06195 [Mycolicibacterium neoaurum]KJQ51945.1 hypothetical protein TS71_04450 [Mycolicibacterium neoaurum]
MSRGRIHDSIQCGCYTDVPRRPDHIRIAKFPSDIAHIIDVCRRIVEDNDLFNLNADGLYILTQPFDIGVECHDTCEDGLILWRFHLY